MIGAAAGVVGSSIVLGPIATAIAAAYKMGSTVNEFINDHIETLKASDNPTISSTGRVLEGAKFGFGLGVSGILCKRCGHQISERRSPNSMVNRVSAAFQS